MGACYLGNEVATPLLFVYSTLAYKAMPLFDLYRHTNALAMLADCSAAQQLRLEGSAVHWIITALHCGIERTRWMGEWHTTTTTTHTLS